MSVAIWVGYPRSYSAGRSRPPQFVTLHYTAGNEGPTSAEAGANYDKTRADGTSTHYFTDSEGPALQEVPEGDRSHAALQHGNEIGIHIEICGTVQTREQWLDPVSYATLVMTAALTREICDRNGFALRRLTVDETRLAYYGKDKPHGINDHGTITLAFPEDGGTHTDVGSEFPWDIFMDLVINGGQPPTQEQESSMLMVGKAGSGATATYWLGDGFYHRQIPNEITANNIIGALQINGQPNAAILAYGTPGATEDGIKAIVGPTPYGSIGGSGPSFETLVDAAEEGANRAEDS